MNTNNTQITEDAAKYLAIAQMSNLLRESTYLDYQHHEMNNTGPDKRVYRNSVFSSDEHETVKRAFLKLCQQI